MTHLKWTELVFSAQLIIIIAQFGFNSGARLLLNGGPAHKATNEKIDGLGNESPGGLGARGSSSKRFGAAMSFGGLPKLGIPAFTISSSVETGSLPSWGWLPNIQIPGMGAEPSSNGRPSNAPVTSQVDGGKLQDLHGSDGAGGAKVGTWSGFGGGLPDLGVPGFCDGGNDSMGLVPNIGLCAPTSSPAPANGVVGGGTVLNLGSSNTNNQGTKGSVGKLTAEVDRAFSSTPMLDKNSGGSEGNDVHREEHGP